MIFWGLLGLLVMLLLLPLLFKDKLVTVFLVSLAIIIMMLPDIDKRLIDQLEGVNHASSH